MTQTMDKLSQVDEREIPAGGGVVTWYLANEDRGTYHLVQLLDQDGNEVNRWITTDPYAARMAYRHPYADPQTPDTFRLAKLDNREDD